MLEPYDPVPVGKGRDYLTLKLTFAKCYLGALTKLSARLNKAFPFVITKTL